jgi:RHS repeat-associated protein
MQLSSGTHIPDGLLAANVLLAENSRQGSRTYSGTLHQGFGFVISHTSLGIIGPLYDGDVRSRCTGKERDTESGNDYFGARYYSSNMGRFMSPDWDDDPHPTPYAVLDDPQSLNLYSYVKNNPLSKTDKDGHVPCGGTASITINVNSNGTSSMSQSADDCPTMSLWDTFLWHRQQFINHLDQRIQAHQPPPQKQSDDQLLNDITNVMMGLVPVGTPKSPGNMQKQVEKGQAPKSVDRVDKGRGPFEKDHIEFKSGDALNQDGTWKHGGRELTNTESDWVQKNGWNLPQK